jgi:hypothetical protein
MKVTSGAAGGLRDVPPVVGRTRMAIRSQMAVVVRKGAPRAAVGCSHVGERERGEHDGGSSRVPLAAGRTSALVRLPESARIRADGKRARRGPCA